jgi:hypothetical protein
MSVCRRLSSVRTNVISLLADYVCSHTRFDHHPPEIEVEDFQTES